MKWRIMIILVAFAAGWVVTAIDAAWQPGDQSLVLFTTSNCKPCNEWKKGFARHGTYENYFFDNYVIVEWKVVAKSGHWTSNGSNNAGNRLVAEFVQRTGSRVPAFPTFWIRGSSRYKVGCE